jgi:hypothetical protein
VEGSGSHARTTPAAEPVVSRLLVPLLPMLLLAVAGGAASDRADVTNQGWVRAGS